MADLSKAQQKRAEARKRRRDQAEPEPQPESAPSNGQDARHGVLQAAKVAAAAGAAGAAVAAAKALTSHDGDAPAKDAGPPDQPEPEEPHEAEEPRATEEPQASEEAELEREPEREPEPRQEAAPVAGAAQSDARHALDRAREQFEDLLGRPIEKVSSLERTHDGWVLALEVVELQRIPETTDVLASYEMELDDELNLRRYQQVRRYHRGRTDEGDDR
jgi:hypothetical protein